MPELRLLHGTYRSASGRGVVLSKLAFLFPGQGAQAVGMGRRPSSGYRARGSCLSEPNRCSDTTSPRSVSKVRLPRSTPPSAANRHCLCAVWRPWKCSAHTAPERVADCQLAAGLSLGEYTAITFAGALDFESALRVVQRRGEAMQAASDAVRSGMVSILGLEIPAVEQLCQEVRQPGEILQIANYLCPSNVVISGDMAACLRAAERVSTAVHRPSGPAGGRGRFPHAVDAVGGRPVGRGLAERPARPRRAFPSCPTWTHDRMRIRVRSASC